MKFINDNTLFESYLKKSGIQQYFSADVHELVRLVSLRKDEYLLYQGVTGDYVYLLFEGGVRMWAYLSEEALSKFDFFPVKEVEIYGEMSSLWGKPSIENIVCNTDCYAFVIFLPTYRDRLLADERFVRFVGEKMTKRYYALNTRLQRAILPTDQRFALLLLEENKEGIYGIPLTDSAQILNISYRTMMRLVETFVNKGFIERKGVRNLQIKNGQALKELAKEKRYQGSHTVRDED